MLAYIAPHDPLQGHKRGYTGVKAPEVLLNGLRGYVVNAVRFPDCNSKIVEMYLSCTQQTI